MKKAIWAGILLGILAYSYLTGYVATGKVLFKTRIAQGQGLYEVIDTYCPPDVPLAGFRDECLKLNKQGRLQAGEEVVIPQVVPRYKKYTSSL